MKTLTVSSSDLTKHDRWDYGFHALREAHEKQAEQLESRFTTDEVREMLRPIALQDLAVLVPLSRSRLGRLTTEKAQVVIRDYPYLALAAVLSHVDGAMQRSNEAIATAHRYKDDLNDLVARTAPEPMAPAA